MLEIDLPVDVEQGHGRGRIEEQPRWRKEPLQRFTSPNWATVLAAVGEWIVWWLSLAVRLMAGTRCRRPEVRRGSRPGNVATDTGGGGWFGSGLSGAGFRGWGRLIGETVRARLPHSLSARSEYPCMARPKECPGPRIAKLYEIGNLANFAKRKSGSNATKQGCLPTWPTWPTFFHQISRKRLRLAASCDTCARWRAIDLAGLNSK